MEILLSLNSFTIQLSLFLLLAPLLNFLSLVLLGRYLSPQGAKVHTYIILLSLNILYFYQFFIQSINNEIIYQYTIMENWINIGNLYLNATLQLDGLSQIMTLLIIFVGSIVHIYAFYYMESDPNLIRFISYLSLFTFSMLLLVLSENMILFFSAWELVGLASFLLIGFWSTRNEARKGAIKAVILNRFGDCAIIGGMGLIYGYTGSIHFHCIFSTLSYEFDTINFLLFIGCMAKSAQLFLHIWLLDAMEGPTPVSALLHAATMVTAGVYLMMRFSYIFEYSNKIIDFITIITTLTIIFGATAALVQSDLKKTIAYSTCSQLAYMFTACGFSGYSQALFHLFTHGFFKALLFLSAGIIIHNLSDEQDIRKMGGLFNLLPITYTFFLIGSLAIIGFPFLAGFYSKDGILELIYSSNHGDIHSQEKEQLRALFSYGLANLGIFFTTLYSLRLLFYVFLTKPNGFKSYFNKNFSNEEAPKLILFLLSLLSLGSIFIGYLFKDIIIGSGNFFLDFSLFNRTSILSDSNLPLSTIQIRDYLLFIESYAIGRTHMAGLGIKIVPLSIIVIAILFASSLFKSALAERSASVTNQRSFVTRASARIVNNIKIRSISLIANGYYINYYILYFSREFLKGFRYLFLVEKAFLEHYGPYGLKTIIWNVSRNLSFLGHGAPHLNKDFQNYITTILLIGSLILYSTVVGLY